MPKMYFCLANLPPQIMIVKVAWKGRELNCLKLFWHLIKSSNTSFDYSLAMMYVSG